MLTPTEIETKASRKYRDYLRSLITQDPFFPLDIKIGRLKTTADYATLRQAVEQLQANSKAKRGFGYTIAWHTTNTRQYGQQTLPQKVYFANEEDYLRLLGKRKEARRFQTAVAHTLAQFPQLRAWLIQYPQNLLKWLPIWPDVLTVCAYFVAHPRPNCYIRELPIPVHTKFIEQNEAILRLLLNQLLPDEAVQPEASTFAAQFYLRQAEPLVRLRLLDETLRSQLAWPSTELGLPTTAVAANDLSAYTIIIIENKMTYLTFPPLPRAIAIWGQGYQVLTLAQAEWLTRAPIHYWGDLDVHGFEILANLRTHFPQVKSLLMDNLTLQTHSQFIVPGKPSALPMPPPLLSEAETAVYHTLRTHNHRLEQERLPQPYVAERIKQSYP